MLLALHAPSDVTDEDAQIGSDRIETLKLSFSRYSQVSCQFWRWPES